MKILLALLISFSAIAQACPNSIQTIKTGTISPCDCWLVSEPKMQELAKTTEKLAISEKLILAQEHLQKLTQGEAEHFKKRSEATEKALSQSEKQKAWIGAGAFLLGVVVTGIAAKAAIESTR